MVSKRLPISLTLGKNERLKSRKLISALFEEGKALTAYPVRMIYLFTPEKVTLQAGFSASSRNFGKAVDRNRLKRLMREAYRLEKTGLQNALHAQSKNLLLFFVYTGKEIADYQTITIKVRQLLNGMIKIVDPENASKHP